MKNKIKEGKSLDITLTAECDGGDVLVVGDLVGVAFSSGGVGDRVALYVEGVFEVPKAAGAGTGFGQGVKVYQDPANGITKTAGSLKFAGHAAEAALDADTTCRVRLIG